jgi:signal transduction histidine kinase
MEEMIQAIGIGSDRITKVVSSLKDFARMDQNAPTRAVCVNEVIEKTLQNLDKACQEGKLRLDLLYRLKSWGVGPADSAKTQPDER